MEWEVIQLRKLSSPAPLGTGACIRTKAGDTERVGVGEGWLPNDSSAGVTTRIPADTLQKVLIQLKRVSTCLVEDALI